MTGSDEAAEQVDIEPLIDHIKAARGFDFSGYKRTSLTRRFVKRFTALGLTSPEEYLRHLDGHDDEYVELFNTVLINVTSFFRDKDTWEAVRDIVIPPILERSEGDGVVRAWVTGCASGEEAYTLAMLLCDAIG